MDYFWILTSNGREHKSKGLIKEKSESFKMKRQDAHNESEVYKTGRG